MLKILVVEDDENIRKLTSKNLSNNGFSIIECKNGQEAIDIFQNQHFDLIITDIMMPKIDGNELSLEIRKINKDIPIIMLTALESFNDKEKGFVSGADDYMVKPVDMKELILRVKALLRRYKIFSENKIEMNSIVLYSNTNTVKVNEENIELTKKEFLLLFKLLSNFNIIFTREQLMNEIWGYDSLSDDRTVDTHIKKLRERITCDDFEIITVRGLGYKAVKK